MTVQCHWRYSRSHSYRCTPFSCADDQDHLIDPAHRRGAGHVPATVATIIKVLSPVQIESWSLSLQLLWSIQLRLAMFAWGDCPVKQSTAAHRLITA
jgi:hypothetical protein